MSDRPRSGVPADLDARMAAFLSNHVSDGSTQCSCGESFPAQRHNAHMGHEVAEVVRMFTTPLADDADRLRATLAEVLRMFVHETYPGRPSLQSHHVPLETVERWRAVLKSPAGADDV